MFVNTRASQDYLLFFQISYLKKFIEWVACRWANITTSVNMIQREMVSRHPISALFLFATIMNWTYCYFWPESGSHFDSNAIWPKYIYENRKRFPKSSEKKSGFYFIGYGYATFCWIGKNVHDKTDYRLVVETEENLG